MKRGAAEDFFISFVRRWATQTGKEAKGILTDGDRDYAGQRWDGCMTDKSIKHVTTARYNPGKNGIAERYTRTVTEQVVSMFDRS